MSQTKITTTNPNTLINEKKRGAPLGNRNAIKHGFYATHFTQQEIADLDELTPLKVKDEIQLLRALMRRVIATLDPNATHADLLDTFRTICLGNVTLTRLIRTQILPTMSSTILEDMNKAFEPFTDHNLKNLFPQAFLQDIDDES